MIKVLLADDNKVTLDLLKKMFDWKKQGFELVCCAENGLDALEAFHQHQPNLVVTDVQMPGMSGIELAREIRKSSPEAVIIFLSNYEEFKYVKSAMNFGAFDYILKHENIEQKLFEKLMAAKKILKYRPQQRRYYEEGSLLSYLSEADLSGDSALLEQVQEVFPNRYDYYLLEQDCYLPPISELLNIHSPEIKENSLKRVCYQQFEQSVAVVKVEPYRFLLMLQNSKQESLAYKVKEQLLEQLYTSFSVLIISENQSIQRFLVDWLKRKHLIERKYFYPTSVVLNSNILGLEQTHEERLLDAKQFKYFLMKNRINELCEQMDDCYLRIVQSKDVKVLFSFLKFLLQTLLPYDQKVMDYKYGITFTIKCGDSLDPWYSVSETFLRIKQKYMQLVQIWKNNAIYSYSSQVQTAIIYIHNHYMDYNISAEEVAEQVGLSVNRLNTLMKEDTGDTVWRFLTKVRVEKSKQLLDSKEYSISDIYPMVGYNTLSYFSRIFKKASGLSPQKYRSMKNDTQKVEI